jgi:DNA-binding MarR family transcriptional regulator
MHVTEKANHSHRGVASSETAREINRDILLHAIHLNQPVSRADLARLTGLQPSTVSVITSQLIEEGWVLPGTLGRLPRGRRPTFVTLNDKHVTLAIDLRPDNANLAVVDINGKILRRDTIAYSAPGGSKAGMKKNILKIAKAARTLRAACGDRIFQGVGVSVSGRVDQKTHRVLFSPNVPWSKIDGERRQRLPLCRALVRKLRQYLQHDRRLGIGRHRRGIAGRRPPGARQG